MCGSFGGCLIKPSAVDLSGVARSLSLVGALWPPLFPYLPKQGQTAPEG
jgi:hypothetical protein